MEGEAPVRLRRVGMADAELLDSWRGSEATGEYNRFGISYPPAAPAIKKTGLIGEQNGELMVETTADGRPIGTVSWHAVRYGPNPESTAWNIGINLIPDARFKGFGAVAQRLLAEQLLATTDVNRIEAMTDVENRAEQRALEKAGFVREGVLRGSQFRDGAWHDLAVYALLRDR